QDGPEALATDHQGPHAAAIGDDRRDPRALAEERQLPDMGAFSIGPHGPLRPVVSAVEDPNTAGEDHEQFVTSLALPHERTVLLEPALGGDRRDALQVLGGEALEQRDATELEHRRDVAGDVVSLGHVHSAW